MDPVFHKQQEYLKPLDKPPYGAFDCTTEKALYAVFTLGGMRSDVDGRILDPEGDGLPFLLERLDAEDYHRPTLEELIERVGRE